MHTYLKGAETEPREPLGPQGPPWAMDTYWLSVGQPQGRFSSEGAEVRATSATDFEVAVQSSVYRA